MTDNPTPVIVRMPPSPTGHLHLGTARTALFNWVLAKANQGEIIFRWEDTDLERSKTEHETEIFEGLKWLGMDFEAESKAVYRQTESAESHAKFLEQLWQKDAIYPCFQTPELVDKARKDAEAKKEPFVFWSADRNLNKTEAKKRMTNESFVWRVKTPENKVFTFQDAVRGEISVNSNTIGDFVVARNDGSVLYLLANVIDDHTQGITWVVRGEDHITNTPKQLILWEALEVSPPKYAHLPLVLDHKGAKLSKRKVEPGVCVLINDFIKAGFLPEAVTNGLAFLGWNPKTTTDEVFSLSEMIYLFNISQINSAGSKYDFDKMRWFNNHWLNRLESPEVLQRFLQWHESFGSLATESFGLIDLPVAVDVIREKARTLKDIEDELHYLINAPEIDTTLLPNEKMKVDTTLVKTVLEAAIKMIPEIQDEHWNSQYIKDKCVEVIQQLELKNGQFLWPVRYSLSGQEKSISPFHIMAIIGPEATVERLQKALI